MTGQTSPDPTPNISSGRLLADDLLAAIDPSEVFARAFANPPLEWQFDYLREHRHALVLKGRQIGASQSAAALAIHCAIYKPNSLTAIVSPSLKQSTEICTRARHGLERLGERLVQDSASLLRLRSGGRILSLPGTASSVRGWSADLLILDEAAYLAHETIVAARALVAATGGRMVVQSTAGAAVGDFYDMCQAPDPTWGFYRVRSDQVSTISADFLASERKAMTPDAFAAEYECQFGRVGASLFSAERIASLVLPK
jgi:hypothetical protein